MVGGLVFQKSGYGNCDSRTIMWTMVPERSDRRPRCVVSLTLDQVKVQVSRYDQNRAREYGGIKIAIFLQLQEYFYAFFENFDLIPTFNFITKCGHLFSLRVFECDHFVFTKNKRV